MCVCVCGLCVCVCVGWCVCVSLPNPPHWQNVAKCLFLSGI